MSDAQWTVLTLGFAAGTVLFAVLAALSYRAARSAPGAPSGLGVALVGLVWNAGRLVECAARLAGAAEDGALCRVAEAVAYTATAFVPYVVLAAIEPEQWGRRWRRQAGRWLGVVSLTHAVLLSGAFLAAALAPGFPLRFATVKALSAYNLVFHLAAGAVIFHGAVPTSARTRAFARNMVVVGVALGAGLLTIMHFSRGASWRDAVAIAAQLSSIPVAVASFALLVRFRFADVFLRVSVALLLAVVTSLAASVFVAQTLDPAARSLAVYPHAAAWVAGTALWCALLLAFPRLEAALRRAIDRWVLRRPDYAAVARRFAEEAAADATEDDVLARAARTVCEALDADRVEVVAADATVDDAEATAAVGDRALAVVPGEGGRALLSDELAFLDIVAERAARRVEAIGVERERREQALRETELERMVADARLRALRAQLNPHFLFNTLNAILDLIGSDPERAEATTERLADVLRYVLDGTDRESIPVGEEVAFLDAYLEIERARFGERLRVEVDVDFEVSAEPIPPLLLQPLVENAVRHGLAPRPEGGTVRITARAAGSNLALEVADDGVGGECPFRGRVGLGSVEARLRAVYGDRATFEMEGEPGRGVRARILIPRRHAPASVDRG
jgi:signal transduction histidine kinase